MHDTAAIDIIVALTRPHKIEKPIAYGQPILDISPVLEEQIPEYLLQLAKRLGVVIKDFEDHIYEPRGEIL